MYIYEEQDRTGNNGPLKRIDPGEVITKLSEMAKSELLSDACAETLADAATLIYLRYDP